MSRVPHAAIGLYLLTQIGRKDKDPYNSAKMGIQMRVHCIVYDQVNLLDVAGPAQVFATAGQLDARAQCSFHTYSLGGETTASDASISLATERLDSVSVEPDIMLVPGSAAVEPHMNDPQLLWAIAHHAKASRLVASICTGSLLLARAGLLTHRQVATHWRFADRLRECGSDICVNEDAIFVEDGSVWTSAGVSSGIDMALALVERFWGRPLAIKVAKELVVPLVRSGGQKQFSTLLELQSQEASGRFSALNAWIHDNASSDCRVEVLAEKCGMSPRSFARHYTAATGETPAKMVELIRIDKAKALIENSTKSFGEIATQCGFKGTDQLRLSFERIFGVTPSTYRATFNRVNSVSQAA